MMFCAYHSTQVCQSCPRLTQPYDQQVAEKTLHLQQQLAAFPVSHWLPAVTSPQQHCRNKAKMVVGGSVERPILGVLHANLDVVDLCDCPLYSAHLRSIFPVIKQFMFKVGLVPYHIARRRGELKYVLVTESQSTQKIMIRFVLRSTKKLDKIREYLPWLLSQHPSIQVVSVNILPQHTALLEGKDEYILTEAQYLEAHFNHIPLFIRQRSFFQTNSSVTAQLYAQAQQWTKNLPIRQVWDLFCGVGGFGLHCVTGTARTLTGIEISQEAIESATQSAKRIGVEKMLFQALDLTRSPLTIEDKPDLVIVNPPRRGLGQHLSQFLATLAPQYILYSSCQVSSLVKDLHLLPDYHIERVQLFDMFPHTDHYEVLALLVKSSVA